MARRPPGLVLVVPQFEDMINVPEMRISVPPEPVANQILQDPIFGHLSSMWNNIETSQELSLRHQTNEIALAQGAATAGIPVDVMRKTRSGWLTSSARTWRTGCSRGCSGPSP